MDETLAVEALAALAQDTRLRAFRLLMEQGPEGLPAGEVARRLGTPANTMSTHLAILSRAGLVRARREGRLVIHAVELGGIRALLGYLVEECCGGRRGDCAPLLEAALRSRPACPPHRPPAGDPA